MSATPRFQLPLMATNDAQKEVLFNEAILAFDAVSARTVLDILTTPPSTPADGDTYIIGTGATGVWAGKDNSIVFYYSGWVFLPPTLKMKMYVISHSNYYSYSGTTWVADPTSTISVLDDLADVNATSPSDGWILQYNASLSRWVAQANSNTSTLAALTDVDVAGVAGGAYLRYNSGSHKWEPAIISIPTVVNHLVDLVDVDAGSRTDGYVLAWDNADSKAIWVAQAHPVPSTLSALTDVNTSGAIMNDVLTYNGSVWAPSTAAFNFKFSNMSDGPGTLVGGAGKFLIVDPAETALMFQDLTTLLAGTSFRLATLPDVDQPVLDDTYIGKIIQLYKHAPSDYRWAYVDLPSAMTVSVHDDGTSLTTALTDLVFSGFRTAHTGGIVTVQPPVPVGYQLAGTDVGGVPVTKINFYGTGVGVTNSAGILEVDITAGSTTLAGLTDVVLSSPTNGDYLKFDGTHWINHAFPSIPVNLEDLGDVLIASVVNGQVLTWNSTAGKWENQTPSTGVSTLAALTDVAESGLTDGDYFRWHAATSKWINDPGPIIPTVPTHLTDLLDINAASPTDGELLTYRTSDHKWHAEAFTLALSGLTDVDETTAPTDGQYLTYDNGSSKWKPHSGPFDVGMFYGGTIAASSQLLFRYIVGRAVSFPANFSGSQGFIGTNPTATCALVISKNGTQIGTASISTAGAYTFTSVSGTAHTLAAGDRLEVFGPSTTDATAADFSVTLVGSKS